MKKVKEVGLLSNNKNCYRPDEIPTVIGVRNVKPDDLGWRKCYMVQYEDGYVDYIPFKEVKDIHSEGIANWYLITKEE